MLKVEKLNEKLLEDVAGGITEETYTAIDSASNKWGFRTAYISALSSAGCGIASCVYFAKANKAKNSGNIEGYNKYIKKAKNCTIAATSLVGASALALFASKAVPSVALSSF